MSPRPISELLAAAAAEGAPGGADVFLLRADQEAGEAALRSLLSTPGVVAVDTLAAQLAELVETRHPSEKPSAAWLADAVQAHLRGTPVTLYGTWVFYPWRRTLVHVLPAAEFRELRTSRNRNKITADEQARLADLVVGVVGLSVGQATAVTLATEGVGGHFRLADFDTLSLSNMNRLRACTADLGLNKAVMTARQILEQDPYADIQLFPEGLREDNVNAFLLGPPRLGLLLEECDDLAMKVLLRQHARARRIPVLMESSDRGMIDVERFDREPERPLFHGLAGDLDASRLRGLSTYEKVPVVMAILGGPALSPRMAASLVDVETTLKTWPQLASAVALGGALNTDVARRVALGQFTQSGRFHLDPEEVVRDRADPAPPLVQSAAPSVTAPVDEAPPALERARGSTPSVDELRRLVTHAALAPSGGNCQPWRFFASPQRVRIRHDAERSASFLDHGDRAAFLAIGAAAENLVLAAGRMGLGTDVLPFPVPSDPRTACDIRFTGQVPVDPDAAALADAIGLRVTNRRRAGRVPWDPADARAMDAAAAVHGGRIAWVSDEAGLREAGNILGLGDRVRMLHAQMHAEMYRELRFTTAETRATRDGLDVATLELTAAELAGLRLVGVPAVRQVLGRVGGGHGLDRLSREFVDAASAVGLLFVRGDARGAWLRGGRAMQRAWLAAQSRGLAFQPMTSLTYMLVRCLDGADGFDAAQRDTLASLEARLRALFPPAPDESRMLLFRVGRAGPPTARSLRRGLEDVMELEGGTA